MLNKYLHLLEQAFNLRFSLYLVLIVCAATYGLLRYRSLSTAYRRLAELLVLVVISELFGRFSILYFGTSHYAYHLLIPLELVYYTLIYSKLLAVSSKRPGWIRYAGVLLALASLLYSLLVTSFNAFPSSQIAITSLVVTVLCLSSLWFMLRYPVEMNIYRQPVFWFNIGNLVFYTCTFFVFGFYSYTASSGLSFLPMVPYVIWAANMLMYSCYLRSLYVEARLKPLADEY